MSVLPVLSCGSYAGATPPWMGSKGVLTSVMPTLDLNFAACNELDPRITFTRASFATYFNSNGVMQTANVNVPRFDYNPITGESKGLLIEEQRTNLLIRSQEFDNAAWTKPNNTITINSTSAPDGTNTASTFTATGLNPTNYQSIVCVPAQYTFSMYLKAGTDTNHTLSFGTSGTALGGKCVFDLSLGTAGTPTNYGSTTGTTASITPVGNGWYRCSITVLCTAATYFVSEIAASSSGTVYIWGAQLEAGSFPTSYIPTVASQVTRSADSASMTGSNFSSWYRADEGTVYAAFKNVIGNANFMPVFSIDGGSIANEFLAGKVSGNGLFWTVDASGSNQGNATPSVTYLSDNYIAFGIKTNDLSIAFNGSSVATDTTLNMPTVDRLRFGNEPQNRFLNGTIKRIAYYPKRLSNTELQGLTS